MCIPEISHTSTGATPHTYVYMDISYTYMCLPDLTYVHRCHPPHVCIHGYTYTCMCLPDLTHVHRCHPPHRAPLLLGARVAACMHNIYACMHNIYHVAQQYMHRGEAGEACTRHTSPTRYICIFRDIYVYLYIYTHTNYIYNMQNVERPN